MVRVGPCAGVKETNQHGSLEEAELGAVDELSCHVRCLETDRVFGPFGVEFLLNYTETDSEGQDHANRVPMNMKLRNGSTTSRKVDHRIDRRSTLSEWSFEVIGCEPCDDP